MARRPEGLPWRGPGPGRPDLPLPPGPMPILRGGRLRKRWRYVGVYGERLMLCAGKARIGPVAQDWWAIWDREQREFSERTSTPRRRRAPEVVMDGPHIRIEAEEVRAELELGEATPVEAVCPSGERGYGWTRKLGELPVACDVRIGERRLSLDGHGLEDESAGYHRRHISWLWSAGVGRAVDGRSVGWNLVQGINDPPRRSERAIWVEGKASEPGPVSFDGLSGIRFDDGSGLRFSAEAERSRNENRLLFRSFYRQPFGTFSGSFPGLELEQGYGVMEQHDVVW
jgi:uncharacterized protein DUF2804